MKKFSVYIDEFNDYEDWFLPESETNIHIVDSKPSSNVIRFKPIVIKKPWLERIYHE